MNRKLLYALIGAAGLTLAGCDKPPTPSVDPKKDTLTPTAPVPDSPGKPALPAPNPDAPPAKK